MMTLLTGINYSAIRFIAVWRLIFAVVSHLSCSSPRTLGFFYHLDFSLLRQSLLAADDLQLRLVKVII